MNDVQATEDSRRDPRAMELDRDLLSTPFSVQTRWHVLTGAICCGKTTLIDMLAEKGFRTLPEASREYIEREVAKGRTLEELFGSAADERVLTKIQCDAEHRLSANEVTFLDRALPDYLWFWRLFGMNPNELLAECFRYRYASVFILDQLPLQLDGARIDDEVFTDLLDEWLTRDYGALGYCVVRVPVMPPEERLAFVIETLSEQRLL
ncbi:MAG: ATP-binding protein [Chloroflexota bacterium]|nr:MAG: ATP-binding protein [Chloroflexota bacterium]